MTIPLETPDAVLIHWPDAATVADPRRLPFVAIAVITVMDETMLRLAKLGRR